jgi:hypothetical protein
MCVQRSILCWTSSVFCFPPLGVIASLIFLYLSLLHFVGNILDLRIGSSQFWFVGYFNPFVWGI